MPHRGADWGPMLTAAGFTVEGEHTIAVNIEGSRSEAIGRYALGGLQRIRGAVAESLSPRTSPRSTNSSTPAARTASCGATT